MNDNLGKSNEVLQGMAEEEHKESSLGDFIEKQSHDTGNTTPLGWTPWGPVALPVPTGSSLLALLVSSVIEPRRSLDTLCFSQVNAQRQDVRGGEEC